MKIGIRRSFAVVLLLLVLPLAAEAYTIVLRDGRRIEIPNAFEVGTSTLTYETAPGIQITLQLAIIDVAKTELANKEASGSLLKRSNAAKNEQIPVKTSGSGFLVTNEDLERFRQARIAGERASEKRRKELGLPSVEESRRETMSAGDRAQAQLLRMRTQAEQSEAVWRTRAFELRQEIIATNERINFIETRLNQLPLNYSFGGFTAVSPFLSVDQLARGANYPLYSNRGSLGRAGFQARVGFGNERARGQVQFNSFPGPRFFGRRVGNRFPYGNIVALPFDSYDSSFERATLAAELSQLLVQRAALQARWRLLEDEARRSGAYPGWLR